jgi:hypothetical protein
LTINQNHVTIGYLLVIMPVEFQRPLLRQDAPPGTNPVDPPSLTSWRAIAGVSPDVPDDAVHISQERAMDSSVRKAVANVFIAHTRTLSTTK